MATRNDGRKTYKRRKAPKADKDGIIKRVLSDYPLNEQGDLVITCECGKDIGGVTQYMTTLQHSMEKPEYAQLVYVLTCKCGLVTMIDEGLQRL